MDFGEAKHRLWSEGEDDVFPPLRPQDVERAEQVLGVRLPAAYVELLEVRNGGAVSRDFDALPTDVPTSWADDHVGVDEIFGIAREQHHASIVNTPESVREWGLPAGVVPFCGDGHWYLALDYRKRGPQAEPSVSWIDVELEEEAPLAPDFRTFVERLVPGEQFDVEIDREFTEPIHARRGPKDATVCGRPLDKVEIWVSAELFQTGADRACPDCVRLLAEWAEVDAPPAPRAPWWRRRPRHRSL